MQRKDEFELIDELSALSAWHGNDECDQRDPNAQDQT